MNTIKRDVYVLKNTIKIPIEVTKGTDAITFEFTVRDYNLPATAAAVAYAYRMGMKKPNSTFCDVSGNVISFQPSVNFFEVGNNELQIRVINEDKSLISFKEKVKCSDSMGFPDEEEETDRSLIEQIIAQSGKESGERKAADAQERAERIEADAKEKSERQKEIATERARIDQLTKMGEGSTTGDAELSDIRVGNEGATYSNAGNAVRSQTKGVPAMMDNLQSPYVDISLLEQGSLNNTGTEITSSKVLRSVEFHWNKNGKITAPSGYKIAIANYAMQSDESGQRLQVYQSATDYGDSQTSSKADGDTEFRRLLIKRSDGADINTEDLRGKITTNVPGLRAMDVIENLEKKIKTDTTLEKEGVAADAAETGKRISQVEGDIGSLNEDLVNINESIYRKKTLYNHDNVSLYESGSKADTTLYILTTNSLINEESIPCYVPKGSIITRFYNPLIPSSETANIDIYFLKRSGKLTFEIVRKITDIPNGKVYIKADDDYFIGIKPSVDYNLQYNRTKKSNESGGYGIIATASNVGDIFIANVVNDGRFFAIDVDIIIPLVDSKEITNIGVNMHPYLFESPVNAINAITDSGDDHIYNVFVGSGVYNIMNLLGGDSFYATITESTEALAGLLLPNMVNLYGKGNVVFKGEIPASKANNLLSTKVSTINTKYSNIIENIEFTARNLRYSCHDETSGTDIKGRKKIYRNCKFIHLGNDSGLWTYTNGYACGFNEDDNFVFDGCEFNSLSFHNNLSNSIPSIIEIKNCIIHTRIKFGSVGSGNLHKVYINNCNIGTEVNSISESGITTENQFEIVGGGNSICYYTYLDKPPIITNDTELRRNGTGQIITKGTAVRLYYGQIRPCNGNADLFFGIALEDIAVGGIGAVKIGGYCLQDIVGITSHELADNVSLSGSSVIIGNDNVIGKFVDDGNYFKLIN